MMTTQFNSTSPYYEPAIAMRLEGYTYAAIGDELGVSRQRIQQIIGPSKGMRGVIVKRAGARCENCQRKVGQSGHVHHKSLDAQAEDYNNIANLQLLCIRCHRAAHRQRATPTEWPSCRICGEPVRGSVLPFPRHRACPVPRIPCRVCGKPMSSTFARQASRLRRDSRYTGSQQNYDRHQRCIEQGRPCGACGTLVLLSPSQRWALRTGRQNNVFCNRVCNGISKRLTFN
jgi:hypothetical protein